jgi:hypothetical protein
MTKGDWKKVLVASAISVFVGLAVLVFIIARRKRKLSKSKLKKIVEDDLQRWSGITETSNDGLQMVQWYWALLGLNFSLATLATSTHRSSYPWSAAYISSVMKRWGAGNRFGYSPSHSNYIMDAKEERNNPKGNIFTAYRIQEAPVQVGDLLAVDRGFGINYDNVYRGAQTHTDIVFKVDKSAGGYVAYTVGGNISDTVKVREVPLNADKKIIDTKYFAVLKNTAI